VEAGDLEAHQLADDGIDRPLASESGTEGGERLEHDGIPGIRAGACRGTGLALGLLAEMPDLVVDFMELERIDSRHRGLPRVRDSWIASGLFARRRRRLSSTTDGQPPQPSDPRGFA